MSPVIAALLVGLIATTIGSIMLRKYSHAFKVKSQLFRFHELRDKLQLLAVEGKITPVSEVYDFLESTINLAIRNAGSMSLSDVLGVAKNVNAASSSRIFDDIRNENEEVQQLSSEIFNALYEMLLWNDDLTYAISKLIDWGARELSGAVRSVARAILGGIFPQRSKAARLAIRYRQLSQNQRTVNAV